MTLVKAKASVFGAVSVVNAIASGKGGAASVNLSTEAEVELEASPGEWETIVNGKRMDSKLGVETVRSAIRRAGKDPASYSGKVETTSKVPIGVGLKTSSASSTAIATAAFAAIGQKGFDPKRVLDCSVEASLASGASITGAMDDAAGCLLGGVSLTDNLARRVVSSKLFERRLLVAIVIPKTGSRRGSVEPGFIRRFGSLTNLFFEMALKGDYWRAMVLNGMVYSSILKYDPFPALRAVELGALEAGLSGTGPAVAAVFYPSKKAEMEELVRDWSSSGSEVIQTQTNNEHGRLLSVE